MYVCYVCERTILVHNINYYFRVKVVLQYICKVPRENNNRQTTKIARIWSENPTINNQELHVMTNGY